MKTDFKFYVEKEKINLGFSYDIKVDGEVTAVG
jgi:hypothetical protein